MRVLWPIAATLIASGTALAGTAIVTWLGRTRRPVLDALFAFAVGALLGAAMLDIVPHALAHAPAPAVGARFLAGALGFLAFERLVRWRHAHPGHPTHHLPPIAAAAPLVLWSDALHNLVDGFAIGAAFAGGVGQGMSTTLAVIAHEIPQEVGDFAVLLAAGMAWRRALLLNWLVQLPPILAAAATFVAGERVEGALGWLLPIAAGSLVYIALADLVPSLHHRARGRAALAQLACVLLGVIVVAAIGGLLHEEHGAPPA